jgi:hypothetical protein
MNLLGLFKASHTRLKSFFTTFSSDGGASLRTVASPVTFCLKYMRSKFITTIRNEIKTLKYWGKEQKCCLGSTSWLAYDPES